jgi:putative transposase
MHYIWGTKNHQPIITKTLVSQLISHYKEKYPIGSDVYVDTANGIANHFHLLVGQMPVVSASQVANQLKGESSHWINSNDFLGEKFAWQEGFGVFSVSHSMVDTVRKYIFNQQEHHRKLSYEEEVDRFLKAHEIEIGKYEK